MSITLPSGTVVYTQEEYEAAQLQIKELGGLNERMLKDFNTISAALLEEALEREWCDQYDEFVDNINNSTSTLKLDNIKKQYTVHVLVTRKLTQMVTVDIEAKSEDDARENVEYDPTDWIDIDDSIWDEEDEYEIDYVEEK